MAFPDPETVTFVSATDMAISGPETAVLGPELVNSSMNIEVTYRHPLALTSPPSGRRVRRPRINPFEHKYENYKAPAKKTSIL